MRTKASRRRPHGADAAGRPSLRNEVRQAFFDNVNLSYWHYRSFAGGCQSPPATGAGEPVHFCVRKCKLFADFAHDIG